MKILYYCILSTMLLSCVKKGSFERIYYDTGELESEKEKIDDSTSVFKRYHKNGQLLEKVTLINGNANGPACEYYPDGDLKWNGYYKNNCMVQPKFSEEEIKKLKCFFILNKEFIHEGDTCKVRTYVEGFHPTQYEVGYSIEAHAMPNPNDSDLYPDIIVPSLSDSVFIVVYLSDSNRVVDPDKPFRIKKINVIPRR